MFKKLVEELKFDIDQCLRMGVPPIAAFDADGTLWPQDVGEDFFHFQLRNKLIANPPPDPWKYYLDLKSVSPRKAYLWLAQINEGHSDSDMLQWSRDNISDLKQNQSFNPFGFQRELVDYLLSQNVSVYVVTASIKWAVMGAVEELGLPKENVIGVSVTLDKEGCLTDIQEGPITWQEGKVEGLYHATGGVAPFYVSGNTMGDLPLLNVATNIKTVVTSAPKDQGLYETEQELYQHALRNFWYTFNVLKMTEDTSPL